jgi:hypothetical protein
VGITYTGVLLWSVLAQEVLDDEYGLLVAGEGNLLAVDDGGFIYLIS